MMKRKLLATAAVLALAATIPARATVFDRDVTTVKSLMPAGDSFAAHLAREYRDFSMFESEQMFDWPDADHFAEKAYAAERGAGPQPEHPEAWNIGDSIALGELRTARERLIAAMDQGAASKAPHEAAVAQAKYDCWVEQQEEGWQYQHIAACKQDFDLAMEKLATAIAPPPVAAAPAPMPKKERVAEARPEPAAVKTQVTEIVSVHFDFDKAQLTPTARQRIDRFADEILDKDAVEIVVTGHADRAGPSDYNVALSERRAKAVRAHLMEHGLTISALKDFELNARGESDPVVATADGVPEPANRRVVLFGLGYADSTRVGALNQ